MRLRITLALTALATLALAATALGGDSFPQLKGSKNPDGPFAKDTFLNLDAKRDLYTKITSTDDRARRWYLYEGQGGPGEGDYATKWFHGNDNITAEVQGGGYKIRLKPGEPERFRISVKPAVDTPDDVCLYSALEDGPEEVSGAAFGINGNNCG